MGSKYRKRIASMNISSKDIQIGQEIPRLIKKAKLTPPRGGYPWGSPHNEEYAKSLGFKGPLIAGSTALAYISESMLHFFGEGWIKGGKLDVSFIGGVVDGETVTVKGFLREKVSEDSAFRLVIDVWMENEDGEKVITGTASGLIT
jgi:hypothetical protein